MQVTIDDNFKKNGLKISISYDDLTGRDCFGSIEIDTVRFSNKDLIALCIAHCLGGQLLWTDYYEKFTDTILDMASKRGGYALRERVFTWISFFTSYMNICGSCDGVSSSIPTVSPVFTGRSSFNYDYFDRRPFSLGNKSVVISYSGGKESVIVDRLCQDLCASKIVREQILEDNNDPIRSVSGEAIVNSIRKCYSHILPDCRVPYTEAQLRMHYNENWASIPKENGPFYPSVLLDKLALIAAYGDAVEYILFGDEIETCEYYKYPEFNGILGFGVDWPQSQLANNLLSEFFLERSRTRLVSPVTNLTELQLQAIFCSLKDTVQYSCWKSARGWCNNCPKCYRIGMMLDALELPHPEGLVCVPRTWKVCCDDVAFMNVHSGGKPMSSIQSLVDMQVALCTGRPISSEKMKKAGNMMRMNPKGFLAMWQCPQVPHFLGEDVCKWFHEHLEYKRDILTSFNEAFA